VVAHGTTNVVETLCARHRYQGTSTSHKIIAIGTVNSTELVDTDGHA
jgi:hypothetical protein